MLEMEYYGLFGQYHACRCLGSQSHQSISRHGIGCVGQTICIVIPQSISSTWVKPNPRSDLKYEYINFAIFETIQHVKSWNELQWFDILSGISFTHWGRATHISVGNLIAGWDNGLSPGRRQAIIWTNPGILLIGPSGTNFSEILIKILTFSFKKMRLKVLSAKWRPFCLGLNVLIDPWYPTRDEVVPFLAH